MIKVKTDKVLRGEGGRMQFIRYTINGLLAAAVHYGVYFLLLLIIYATAAYAIGYVVSFLMNYFTTCRFVFRQQPSWKHFIGFSGSHCVNFTLQMLLFECFIRLLPLLGFSEQLSKLIAPVFVMAVAMLVQFSILRFVFRKKQ